MMTPRFCSPGYISMQISAMDELDGVWHKSLNSYRDNVIRDAIKIHVYAHVTS